MNDTNDHEMNEPPRSRSPEETTAALRRSAKDTSELITDQLLPSITADQESPTYPYFYVCQLLNHTCEVLDLISSGEVNQGQSRIATNLLTAVELIEKHRFDNDAFTTWFIEIMGTLDTRLTIDGYNIAPEQDRMRSFKSRQ